MSGEVTYRRSRGPFTLWHDITRWSGREWKVWHLNVDVLGGRFMLIWKPWFRRIMWSGQKVSWEIKLNNAKGTR